VDAYQYISEYRTKQRTKLNFKINRQISKLLNIFRLEYSGKKEDGDQLIFLLQKDTRNILEVGYDTPVQYRNTTPNDEFYQEQWNLDKIQAPQVWRETIGGKTANGDELVIAVLEKGIDINHPDLLDNIWKNTKEIPDNNIDDDQNGYIDDYLGLNLNNLTDEHPILSHGTQVSGIIGAKTDNEIGMAGINWNAKILFLSGVDLTGEVIEAYEYLYNLRKLYNESDGKKGAFIVVNNNSFGWDNTRPENLKMGLELCQMYDKLGEVGILSVGAGPNNNVDVEIVGDTPTNCTSDFFIGVTSTNEADEKSEDSGFGKTSIDLGAPGENITATDKNNSYGMYSGTSFAAPHVTGAIALMYSIPCGQLADDAKNAPIQTAGFIKNILLAGTDALPTLESRAVSGGRLNVFKAMTNLQVYCGTKNGSQLGILNLYPNPTSDVLTLEYETADFEEYQLMISNSLGQILFQKTFTPPRFANRVLKEDINWLSPGVYTVTLFRNDSHISRRFVVNRFSR
jgi:subtilisin family serine protease